MKKKIITPIAILFMVFLLPPIINASPPDWAPAIGYREQTRHIYFPQQNIYFDLGKEVYMYDDGGVWFIIKSVPERYKNVNLRNSPQVQLFLNSDVPFTENIAHQTKYKYLVKESEKTIREAEKVMRKEQKAFEKAERKHEKKDKLPKNEKKI